MASEDVRGARRHGVAVEGRLAVERLVERDGERELIAARAGPLADELLGRHVGRRSHDRTVAREGRRERCLVIEAGVVQADLLRALRLFQPVVEPREAEVEHLHAAPFVDDRVLRLEVAVQDARRVRALEPATRLEVRREDVARAPLLLAQPLAERETTHVLHRDEDLVAEGADVVGGDDVRVRDLGHGLRLAQQARARLAGGAVGGGLGAQDLDRHPAFELVVEREVDDAHAAAAQTLQDQVAIEGRSRRQLACFARLEGTRALRDGEGSVVVGEHRAPG